jgi:hypothetical protein
MAVPKRTLFVCTAAAANMAMVSGADVSWVIQTCRTPAASAALMAATAAAASVPYITSPTRSRIDRNSGVCDTERALSLFCMSQILSHSHMVCVFSLKLAHSII